MQTEGGDTEIRVFSSESEMTIEVNIMKNQEKFIYKKIFTLAELKDISNIFIGYNSVKNIEKDIQSQVNSGRYNIEKKDESTISFFCFGDIVHLSIPRINDKINDKLQSELNKMQETIQKLENYELTIKKFKKIFCKLKDKLNTLETENDRFKKERENISEYLRLIVSEKSGRFLSLSKELKEKSKTTNEKPTEIPKDKKIKDELLDTPFDLVKLNLIKTVSCDSSIICICILKDGRIACCCDDKKIKVFDDKDFHILFVLLGNSSRVNYATVLKNGNFISVSEDGQMKIWRIFSNTGIVITTVEVNGGWQIKVIQLSDNRVATCGQDGIIRIFDENPEYHLVQKLVGHRSEVTAIVELKNKTYIVSAGRGTDKSVRFWNTSNYACTKILEDIDCFYHDTLIETSDNKLFVGYHKITIINSQTLLVEKIINFEGLSDVGSFLEIRKDKVLCGVKVNKSYSFMIVDIKQGVILDVHPDIHKDSLYGMIKLNDSSIVSYSSDKNMKIWK